MPEYKDVSGKIIEDEIVFQKNPLLEETPFYEHQHIRLMMVDKKTNLLKVARFFKLMGPSNVFLLVLRASFLGNPCTMP